MALSDKSYQELLPLVIQYIKANPLLSRVKLSKLIIADNAQLNYSARSIEQVISRHRAEMITANETLGLGNDKSIMSAQLPESLYQYTPPYILPITNGKTLIIADVHIPYHDIQALETMFEYVKQYPISNIVLLGDILDCYSLSRFSKIKSHRNFNRELKLTIEFLGYLKNKFPKANIFFKEGNHELRFELYKQNTADEFQDVEGFTLPDLLQLKSMGIIYIPLTQLMKCGVLNMIHATEMNSSGGINIARNRLLKAFENLISSHSHVAQNYIHRTIGNSVIGSYTMGCLCGLQASYAIVNNWTHGFALAEFDSKGHYILDNLTIFNGSVFH